uniref:G-protein coupled receptors family 1 profile domain-containing protein n=1 Tax=Panagrolaimus sp. ES5 TaxID=591445 RepID=A0AC34FAN4_9BILA
MLWIAWGIACLLSLPQLYIFGVVSPPDMPGFRQCAPIWMSMKSQLEHQASLPETSEEERINLWHEYLAIGSWERAYNITHLLFVFWFPAFAIVISYISVLCILKSFSRPSKAALKDFKIKNTIISMIYNSRNRRNENNKFVASVTSANGIQNDASVSAAIIVTTACLKSPENSGKDDDAKSLILLEEIERGNVLRRSFSAESKPISPVSLAPEPSRETFKFTKPAEKSKVGTMAMQTIAIARSKTKKQAAFILIAYLTLWTPYNLFAIINIFIPTDSRGYFLNRIMDFTPFLNSLIVVNSLVNPLIYGVFDRVPA